jgi:hypothetical protein
VNKTYGLEGITVSLSCEEREDQGLGTDQPVPLKKYESEQELKNHIPQTKPIYSVQRSAGTVSPNDTASRRV